VAVAGKTVPKQLEPNLGVHLRLGRLQEINRTTKHYNLLKTCETCDDEIVSFSKGLIE
jgi:hypothetical protein